MSDSKILTPGMTFGPLTIVTNRETSQAYAHASGDFNPIHLDDVAAQRLGLPQAIAHGMWTMGAALRILDEAGISIDELCVSFCRFGKPLLLNDDPTVATVTAAVSNVDETGLATVAIEVHCGDDRIAKLEAVVVA